MSTAYASEGTVVVWSEPVGDDFEIFGSLRKENIWTDAVRLVWATETDILACAMPLDETETSESNDTSRTVVVWTKMTGFDHSRLTWLVWTDGETPDEPSTFETGFEVNTGVSMVKDDTGTIWLGWAAFDGTDDDIFMSRWRGQGWSEPVQINTEDELPDIQPNLGVAADGKPWVSWLGLADGGYQRYFSRLDGVDWSEEIVLTEPKARDFEKLLVERLESLPVLPDHVSEPTKACITNLDGHIVQTLRYPEPKPADSGTAPTASPPTDAAEGG